MEQVKKTATDTTKFSEFVDGCQDYKEALKRLKATQDSEEGLIPIWNHVYIYKLYCKNSDVKGSTLDPLMASSSQRGHLKASVIRKAP